MGKEEGWASPLFPEKARAINIAQFCKKRERLVCANNDGYVIIYIFVVTYFEIVIFSIKYRNIDKNGHGSREHRLRNLSFQSGAA